MFLHARRILIGRGWCWTKKKPDYAFCMSSILGCIISNRHHFDKIKNCRRDFGYHSLVYLYNADAISTHTSVAQSSPFGRPSYNCGFVPKKIPRRSTLFRNIAMPQRVVSNLDNDNRHEKLNNNSTETVFQLGKKSCAETY